MRLTSFMVQGFKNLVAPVKLEGLGPINVLHGANNVGKSNLLKAIELLARLINATPGEVTDAALLGGGVVAADLFNYAVPGPIHLSASFAIEREELVLAGFPQPTLGSLMVSTDVSLARLQGAVLIEPRAFHTAEGTEFSLMPPGDVSQMTTGRQAPLARRYADFFKSRLIGARAPYVGVDRRPGEVIDALYDASVSPDQAKAMQWSRFVEVMGVFRDILGEGRFLAVLPRGSQQADLLFETRTMRVPFHALGSGVQSLIGLFGHLLICGAAIVSVEEPELNLRWSLQERVRDALRDLVGKQGAPAQLFLTSHSGAFESGEWFYLMQPGTDGPTVDRRRVSDAPLVVGGLAPAGSIDAPRAPTRVSSEGTLRLPERIRKAVGVEHGGNLSFVDTGEGVVEMMSVDTFLKRAGLDDDDA